MYKGKRYNFIVVGLIFIMAFVVGISAGMSSSSSGDPTNIDGSIPEEVEIEEEVIIPEGLVVPGLDAGAFERLEFAFSALDQSPGYKSYVSQTLTTLGQTQYMQFYKYRGGGLDLSEEFFNMPNAIFGLGKNETIITYSDGVNMKQKTITDGSKYSYKDMTYSPSANGLFEEFSYYDYTVTQNRNPLNDFFLVINSNTSSVSYYDKKARGKDYYTITFSMNISKLPSTYLETFYANGAKSVNIKKLDMTLKINKTTGTFMSYEKSEIFYADYGAYGAEVETAFKETLLSFRSQEDTIKTKTTALGWI